MKTYVGKRTGYAVDVTVDGKPLNPRFDLRNHSPTGFEWGYNGSGPAQLALALLADCLGNDREALFQYQDFKCVCVSILPHLSWTLTQDDIMDTLEILQSV